VGGSRVNTASTSESVCVAFALCRELWSVQVLILDHDKPRRKRDIHLHRCLFVLMSLGTINSIDFWRKEGEIFNTI
jgi:hypothetical protein